jgi:alpha-tubulin suppressor-like RCC1 family protein
LGDLIDRYTPTLIPSLNNIIQITCGGAHSVVLNSTGIIISFGGNGVKK